MFFFIHRDFFFIFVWNFSFLLVFLRCEQHLLYIWTQNFYIQMISDFYFLFFISFILFMVTFLHYGWELFCCCCCFFYVFCCLFWIFHFILLSNDSIQFIVSIIHDLNKKNHEMKQERKIFKFYDYCFKMRSLFHCFFVLSLVS